MIWYPYEQMKTMKDPYKILDAEGVHLYTKDQKLIDSISSWWCMIHGYKHPELTEAIKEQADRHMSRWKSFLRSCRNFCQEIWIIAFFQIPEALLWRFRLKWPFSITPIREESAR